MAELADILQPNIQLIGGDGLVEVSKSLVDGVPYLDDALASQGGNRNNRCVFHVDELFLYLFAYPHLRFGVNCVPFVQNDDHGATAIGGETRNALILVGNAQRAVDDKQGDVSAVDGAHGANETVVLDIFVDLAFPAQTGGVDDGIDLAVVLDGGVNRVARGASDVRDDGTLVIGELVGKR